MARPYKDLIREKKQLFKDFYIPWRKKIEKDFATEMAARPNADPELILDRICRPYIHKKLAWTEADKMKVQKGM